MKVLLSWLHEFLPTQPSAEELSKALASVGLEVASCKSLGAGLEDVVVARIQSMKPHPNADRLTLCQVNDGKQDLAIVCGARNMKAGDHVALARVGASLPNGLSIKKSKIRGETSEGMLCSASELGFSEESDGILILSQDAVPGTALAAHLQRNDWLIELDLTPNRGDCLSIIGVAREVGAALGISTKVPTTSGEGPAEGPLRAVVKDPEGAPRYTLRHIEPVKIGESPDRVKMRIEASGIRSINNVVDITNYLLLEWGQPMHAFDREKVKGTVEVRRAKAGEKLLCLDGVERSLNPQDLIIADESGPIAIAGVIGGMSTSVTAGTKSILLESAYFDPRTVRVTARRLGLRTDASHRFERGIDPAATWSASVRALDLFHEVCGATAVSGIDVQAKKFGPKKLQVSQYTIRRVLGEEVKTSGEYLARLGFSVEKLENGWQVEVPPRRHDLEREIDLVEEIARIHGYDRFQVEIPPLRAEPESIEAFDTLGRIRSVCQEAGLSEVRNYSFGDPLTSLGFQPAIAGEPMWVSNPLVPEARQMRQSLLPGLLSVWDLNRKRQRRGIACFELGRVYSTAASVDKTPAREELHLAAIWAGEVSEKTWFGPSRVADFLDARGLVELLERELSWPSLGTDREGIPGHFHPSRAAKLTTQGKILGTLGVLHPRVCRAFETENLVAAELNLGFLLASTTLAVRVRPLSAFPTVERDLAFILPRETSWSEVERQARKAREPILQKISLFDVYEGKGIPDGKKSLAFRLTYGSVERTLTDAEVEESVQKIVSAVESSFGAKLRA